MAQQSGVYRADGSFTPTSGVVSGPPGPDQASRGTWAGSGGGGVVGGGSGGGGGGGRSLTPSTTNPITGINNNNYYNGLGYAYVDKYGFSHVVNDYATALRNAGSGGNIYDYTGAYGTGYALNNDAQRMPIPLPGAVPYGNDLRDKTGYQSIPSLSDFQQQYPGYINSLTPTQQTSSPAASGSASMPDASVMPAVGGSNYDNDIVLYTAGIDPTGRSPEEKAYMAQKIKQQRGY
jgi:hypothetical protein